MKTSFKKINVTDRELSMIQDNIDQVFQKILSQQIIDGNYINNIDMSVGDNSIDHGLPILNGWILTRINAASVIFEKPMKNSKILILNASVACKINLLVF